MSRTYCSEYGLAYEQRLQAAIQFAERNCSSTAEWDEVEMAAFYAWRSFREIHPFPEEHIVSFNEGFCVWLERQLGDLFARGKVEGDRKLQLLHALRRLYRQLRNGEIEYDDPFMGNFAKLGAELGGVVCVNCPLSVVLQRMTKLGQFVARHEVFYL
jgi:hypothetical protein